ncbi:MAG: AAA family ATPase [Candidatus Thiodiazotropha weberae]|uniref:ATPase n=1 Tax=Candidatus Thiodiazotropha endoloripes TaxID=1818881 RepID=A0A1E2USC6_9GAMM|nr:AAA family ATPase [Candidatus Thiodiazotropha endoloripes]MCG7897914.1 AAA family ATPase [Candidatus Thiodiazotropha weberae]MCG7902664.1 AAA family ATPase [Candidatus Thiodiazotropha weberae]ODB89822.1 ATPase [Candidatus Thiodiazotropha endoloripes]ODB97462.1 ATPase [Candidatus Thiodiazotropha endoloripes]
MIIHSVNASNVLKYSSLKLPEIPEQGLIAISGANESGKSSIGETVCFALFGRTFSLGPEELTKVIRWGETHCEAQLEFTCGDGVRYRLERFLDDAGNHSARLAPAGVNHDDQVVRGIEQVADRIYQLIGFEYEEFVESFYLAQREITTPHPHSYAVKTMAGLVTLEYCDAACQEDRDDAEEALSQRQQELGGLQQQMVELDIDPSLMPGLESERQTISRQLDDTQQLMEELDTASTAYQDAMPIRAKSASKAGSAGFFSLIFFLLAAVAGGAWYMLTNMPEHELSVRLNEWLVQMVPDWGEATLPWLLYAAAGAGLLFLVFLIRRGALKSRVAAYSETASTLADVLNRLDEGPSKVAADETQDAQLSEVETDQEETVTDTSGVDETPAIVDRAARSRLVTRISDWSATVAEVRDSVAGELDQLNSNLDQMRLRADELNQAIGIEQERLDRAARLKEMMASLNEKIDERQHYIQTCNLADELIRGTTREVSHQFNRKLRGLVSKTLPLFTENRYEHLQIDDDLTVRAFSSEKRDFMDLDEISSGTQRQIMLAVRLALSQELVARAVKGGQFLFLDEPFAFFDEKRTRSSLTVLPTLSEELNQIWIVAQDFADDLKFDLHIQCDRDMDQLPVA